MREFTYGLRMLGRSRGVTITALLTMALAIGATTTLFSLVDAILLKPLPYPAPERLLLLWRRPPPTVNIGYDEVPWNRADFLELQRNTRAFEAVGAFKADTFNLTGSGNPVVVTGLRATAGFFKALGVAPALGRPYTSSEDRPGGSPVAVLSDALWRTQFGSDPAIIGRVIDLNGVGYEVVGVMPATFAFPRAEEMPASFNFPRQVQVWVPAALDPGPLVPAETSDYAVVGRMRPDSSLARAQADLDAHEQRMTALIPAGKGWFHTIATTLAQQIAAETARPLMFLLGAVITVLLIASANVASLLLTRTMARQREFTIRAALGASRMRLVRQTLTESMTLAVLGGIGGLLLSLWGIAAVIRFGPATIPRLREATLNTPVFLFTLLITLVCGCLVGVAPALSAGRAAVSESLQRSSARTFGGGMARLRRVLLVGEVGLAVVLVVATGLMTRTFYSLLRVDPGVRTDHVLTFGLTLPSLTYPDDAAAARLYTAIRTQVAALPGVEAVGIVETVPMNGATEATALRFPGRAAERGQNRGFANYTVASPGYFRAAGTPLLRGRDFLESDNASSLPVTIINSTMARTYWPGRDPIGQQVGPASSKYPVATIIGITADVKHLSLRDEPQPEMYVPYTQRVYPSLLVMNAVLRTHGDPASLAAAARAAVQSIDPNLPVAEVQTLATIVDDSLKVQRFTMLLVAGFGVVALLMAAVGLYGLVAYSVGQRTREIALRIALGAGRRAVFSQMLTEGLGPAAIGLAIGCAVAAALARAMAGFLFGIRPLDPLTFTIVAPLLLGIALLASALPARRAMRVDPVTALKAE